MAPFLQNAVALTIASPHSTQDALSRLEGRTILVAGAGGGTGEVIARRLAAMGAFVVVADVDRHRATRVAAAIRSEAGISLACPLDATRPEGILEALETAREGFGGLDAIVSTLASAEPGAHGLKASKVREAVRLVRTGAPSLGVGGRFVSVLPDAASGCVEPLITVSRWTALELAPRGIRVDVVAPSSTALEAVLLLLGAGGETGHSRG